MQITSIVKKKADVYEIFVDGEYCAIVDGVVLASRRLKIGSTVDETTIDEIKYASGVTFAFGDAIKYLSRARHTQMEVESKLQTKGYDDIAISGAINKLVEYGYIDDEGYAKAYVAIYSNTRGKNRLRYELTQKGVSRSIIDTVLPEDEYASCFSLADKKKSRYQDKDKLTRYLLGRGYEYEVVRRVVADLE